MFNSPTKPVSINELFINSLLLYRQQYRHVFWLSLLIAGISFVGNYVILTGASTMAQFVGLRLLINVPNLYVEAAMIVYLGACLTQQAVGIKQSVAIGNRRFVIFFLCHLINLAPLLLLTLLALIANNLLSIFFLMLLGLPMLLFFMSTFYASFYAVLRGDSVGAALRASIGLIRMQLGRAVMLLLFALGMILVFNFILGNVFLVLIHVLSHLLTGLREPVLQRGLVASLVSLVVTPWSMGLFLLILQDLVWRRQPHTINKPSDNEDMQLLG